LIAGGFHEPGFNMPVFYTHCTILHNFWEH
jgi:hypothetical protein